MSYPIAESTFVLEMGRIPIQGFIICPQWGLSLKNDSGLPDLPAIVILSEIVHWTLPVLQFDENRNVVGYGKKFKGDWLQLNYKQVSARWGLSMKQVKTAVSKLVSMGLIEREVRTVTTGTGTTIPNVVFVRPNPEAIRQITETPYMGVNTANEGDNSIYGGGYSLQGALVPPAGSASTPYRERGYSLQGDDTLISTGITTRITTRALSAQKNFSLSENKVIEGQTSENSSSLLEKHSKPATKGTPDCENIHKFPEDIADLAEAFCEQFGREPMPDEVPRWVAELRRLKEIGATPAIIRDAFEYAQKEKLNIRSPVSIAFYVEKQRMKRVRQPQEHVYCPNPFPDETGG